MAPHLDRTTSGMDSVKWSRVVELFLVMPRSATTPSLHNEKLAEMAWTVVKSYGRLQFPPSPTCRLFPCAAKLKQQAFSAGPRTGVM